MLACWNLRSNIGLGCWHGPALFGAQTSAKPPNSSFVTNSSRWSHKISKVIKMMPKTFMVLALLACGAMSVRPGSWLSAGHLEPDAVDEVQKRVKEDVGISATPHQVEEFILTFRARYGHRFPDLTKVESSDLRRFVKWFLPLDVRASAVAFCGDLVKAVSVQGYGSTKIKAKLVGAEKLCPQVLTGSLSKMSGAPEWAVDAAQVAEMDGQQHPYGRLDGVAWRDSLKRVCHDECEALVQGIRDQADELARSARGGSGTIEDACSDHVVKHVEAEILGCCSKSCGWNGQFCSFFPFLSSAEQAHWQAECCTERNILQRSSRQQLCDSTLSQADRIKSQKMVDKRPNNEKDREILAQDESRDSKSWSLMERSFGESVDHKCSPPLNLHQIHKELREKEWKRIQYDSAYMDREKKTTCQKKQPSRDECKAFLLKKITHDQNKKIFKYEYICLESCDLKPPAHLPPPPNSILEDLTNQAQSATNFLYVHKKIYSTWKLTWTHINITRCFERIDQQSVDENESLARVSWKELFLGAWSCLQVWHVFASLHFPLIHLRCLVHVTLQTCRQAINLENRHKYRCVRNDRHRGDLDGRLVQLGVNAVMSWNVAGSYHALPCLYLAFLYIFFTFSMHCACHLADVIEVYGIILQRFWKCEHAISYPFCERIHAKRDHFYIFLHLHMPYASF